MANKTITTTIELTPVQLTQIIKNYFKEMKNLEVTNVIYDATSTYDDRFGGPQTPELTKIRIINETKEETFL